MSLRGKTVVLGITGGIAAYKSVSLVSMLRKAECTVHVIMTKNATQFVTPLTFETLSNQPVVVDTFERPERWEVAHVALAKKADVFVIAPATANVLAKAACGLADDMLTSTLLATKAPLFFAPAMNTGMWTALPTQHNVAVLKERGCHFVGPEGGFLACGDSGAGRMSEPAAIFAAIEKLLSAADDFAGLKVMVTAGGTRERLDPVRYLGNNSTGKMGFALAQAAADRGAQVLLVCGMTTAEPPQGIECVRVESTMDLYQAVTSQAPEMDVVIQAAAPADYRFKEVHAQKMKKQHGMPLLLELVENPDIAAAIGKAKRSDQIFVGFAAETEKLSANARQKLEAKNCDLIVANDVTQPGAGFGTDTNIATLITRDEMTDCPLQSKRDLADVILNKVMQLRNSTVCK